MQGQGLVKLIQ